jgi:hypothetical protein
MTLGITVPMLMQTAFLIFHSNYIECIRGILCRVYLLTRTSQSSRSTALFPISAFSFLSSWLFLIPNPSSKIKYTSSKLSLKRSAPHHTTRHETRYRPPDLPRRLWVEEIAECPAYKAEACVDAECAGGRGGVHQAEKGGCDDEVAGPG